MRWSTMHIPTLRDDPAEAGAPSHRLLLRAGYVRQLMAGHYSLLPLAVRVRLKVIGIIRDEMNKIGAQEILMPVMHPAEVWQRSGRWEVDGRRDVPPQGPQGRRHGARHDPRGDRLNPRHRAQLLPRAAAVLVPVPDQDARRAAAEGGPDADPRVHHEGLLQLRPRRRRAWTSPFEAHHRAYARAFERMGIPAIPVEASNGSMGGSGSREFVCPSDAGEDDIVYCPECGYAANREAAVSVLATADPAADAAVALAEPARFDTPGVRTIEDLATGYDAPADRQIKTLVYVLDGALTLVLLRGDHALEEQKLIDATGARSVRPAEARGDLRRARRAPGLARLGRRDRPADPRRPGPAGPVRDGDRRQHRQRAPARRRRRPRRQRREVGRPAGGRGGGGSARSAAAAHGHQGH